MQNFADEPVQAKPIAKPVEYLKIGDIIILKIASKVFFPDLKDQEDVDLKQ